MDKEICVSGATRVDFFNGMGDGSFLSQCAKGLIPSSLTVAERLFSIILEGYASILDAVIKKSTQRKVIGDVSIYSLTYSPGFRRRMGRYVVIRLQFCSARLPQNARM